MSQPDNLDFGPPPVFSSILEYNCQVILAMKTLMCLQDLVESSKCCSRFVPLYHREDRCNLKLSGRILQLFKFREEKKKKLGHSIPVKTPQSAAPPPGLSLTSSISLHEKSLTAPQKALCI
ncbi:Uncharacterized protein Fot_08911 [Forsythia ovata]|uniref:Uncharacterized protein n=1 Tax=Forsythia ovata TaxID=205694 RepID=A0ABD1WCI9_9LAMI